MTSGVKSMKGGGVTILSTGKSDHSLFRALLTFPTIHVLTYSVILIQALVFSILYGEGIHSIPLQGILYFWVSVMMHSGRLGLLLPTSVPSCPTHLTILT